MGKDNYLKMEFYSQAENVSLARLALSAFLGRYEVGYEILEEMKIALSEALSNAIIHGYGGNEDKTVRVEFWLVGEYAQMVVTDFGIGIEDVKQAMEVAYSTKAEHMGLGFAFMSSFCDELEVESKVGEGTVVCMRRKLEDVLKNAV